MTNIQRRTFLAGITGAVVSSCGGDTPASKATLATGMEPGQFFPLLGLPSLDNSQPSSIRAFSGKKTVLHIFASW